MIYVKRPDGTIEQFDEAFDMEKRLTLDKEIQGESFGEILDKDSLSEEDKLSLGLITQKEIDDRKREQKEQELEQAFVNTFVAGFFFSEALQINVDCRRFGKDNDKQNVEGLIKTLRKKGLPGTEVYHGYKEEVSFNVSIEQLTLLIEEMEEYVLLNYEKKWLLENTLKNAQTKEDVDNVNW